MDSNATAYSTSHVVADFAQRDALFPAELAAFGEVWREARGDVFDVGVGGGRTTRYLRGPARSYRAIDFQPLMVAACRRNFPGVDVRPGDARSLRGHADGSYDLVVFSFNGIDYVTPEDRARVRAEALRVLRPGGAFVFSSHNLASLSRDRLSSLALPRVQVTWNPLRLAARGARASAALARRLRNRARLAPMERSGDGWAVVNDPAYDHALLTVYVEPRHEASQLRAAGFVDEVTMIAMDGKIDRGGSADPWIHFVARKPSS